MLPAIFTHKTRARAFFLSIEMKRREFSASRISCCSSNFQAAAFHDKPTDNCRCSSARYSLACHQTLLDASAGETRIQTFGASLGAIHDRVAAVKFEAVSKQINTSKIKYHQTMFYNLSLRNASRSLVLRSRLSAIQR